MKKSYLNKKTKNLLKHLNSILLIGIKISVILALLNACKRTEYIYTEPLKEPITCINTIKTPFDMATCLNEYKYKY